MIKQERSKQKQRDMVNEKYLASKFISRIKGQKSCLYVDQIWTSSGLVQNMLEKLAVEAKFLVGKCILNE